MYRPIYDGASMCKRPTVGLLIPRHEISQKWFRCPYNTDTGPFCQSFHDQTPLSYNGIRTHNLSMILICKHRPQQHQIHCTNGVNTNTSRILRRALGYEGPILLNPQVSMGEQRILGRTEEWTLIYVYWSQTKIIQNFTFNYMRNDNENAFSKNITSNKMSWTVHQLGHVIVHMMSCLWSHNVFIRWYRSMKVAMEIL